MVTHRFLVTLGCFAALLVSSHVAHGAPRIAIVGDPEVGSPLLANVTGGKGSKFVWERCDSRVNGSECGDATILGRSRSIVLKPADAESRVRVTATVGRKKLSSRRSAKVAALRGGAKPAGLTASNPVPLGEYVFMNERFLVRVDSYDGDYTAAVTAMPMRQMTVGSTVPPDGYRFVRLKMTVINVANEISSYSPVARNYDFIATAGAVFGTTPVAHLGESEDPPWWGSNIRAGKTVSGYIYRTVPIAALGAVTMCDRMRFGPDQECRYFSLQ